MNGDALGRLLFIDAPLSPRVATELKRRGRVAISATEAELARRVEDDVLLRALAQRYEETLVIVTADDHMPGEWDHVTYDAPATT